MFLDFIHTYLYSFLYSLLSNFPLGPDLLDLEFNSWSGKLTFLSLSNFLGGFLLPNFFLTMDFERQNSGFVLYVRLNP